MFRRLFETPEPSPCFSGVFDDGEDILKKYEFDKCKPGYDLRKTLESVTAALTKALFEAFGKPFQIILTETLFDKKGGLHGKAGNKERKIK